MYLRTLPFALCATLAGHPQTNKPITAETRIDQVTVYLSGGEVRASTEVDVPAGLNTLTLTGLSWNAYPKSIQITIKGATGSGAGAGFTILSIDPTEDVIKAERAEPRIGRLRDSLDLLNAHVLEINDRIGASQAAKDMLARNYDIGGTGAVLTAEALAKTADFFRERTLKLNREISLAAKEKAGLEVEQHRVKTILEQLENLDDTQRRKVIVNLHAAIAQRARIDLRYLVSNTGWSPTYDLVAKDNAQPITLRYKAQVYNNTGIDWKKMKLLLSTADPSLGASSPELSRWELGGRSDGEQDGYKGKGQWQSAQIQNISGIADPTQRYETVSVSEVTAEFKLSRAYDIPSDARPYMVEVAEHELPADYSYVAIPKLDKDAFLLARVAGWEDLDLVDGPANVYYRDSYVGESNVRTSTTADTLDLSLGRDNNMQIKRIEIEDKAGRRLIGSERKQTMTYEITLKNNSAATMRLELRDQIPVSMNEQIKVEVLELSGGLLDPVEGTVRWPVELAAGASTKVLLSFTIRHPKNVSVKYRTRSRRQKLLF